MTTSFESPDISSNDMESSRARSYSDLNLVKMLLLYMTVSRDASAPREAIALEKSDAKLCTATIPTTNAGNHILDIADNTRFIYVTRFA